MKVLVTGGTGVIGESAVRALHRRGHACASSVGTRVATKVVAAGRRGLGGRRLGREIDSRSRRRLRRDLHIAGIVDEEPPRPDVPDGQHRRHPIRRARGRTLRRSQTRLRVVARRRTRSIGVSQVEVRRRGCRPCVYVATGSFLRPGAVYGPGDEHILGAAANDSVAPRDSDDRRRQPTVPADLA